jgi:uncharacterized cupin superfamily protein
MDHPRELLKAAAIDGMEAQSKTHLVNPNAVRSAKNLGAATGLRNLGVHVMTVQPGHESTEYHRHLYEEQCFYILSGSGTAIIEEKSYPLEPGDFLGFAPKGAAHTFVNTGTEPLVFLAARQMLEQDACDYPRRGKRLYMTGDQEALVDFSQITG